MIRFGLYSTYDKLAKTIGEPFLAVNDEVAKRRFEQTIKQMKEKDISIDGLTVLNLGYIKMNMTANYDYDRSITSFEPNIEKNDEIYDIYNPFQDIEVRKNELEEEKTLEMDGKQMEYVRNMSGKEYIYAGKGVK